jgi:putative FmdB family regulatory protein
MTYEYVCSACRHEWEAEQSISEKPLSTCPRCKKETAKRQISGGAGFILKGGGWYADGYGSSSKSKRSSAESSSGGESNSTSSESKDSKPPKPPKKEAKSKQVAA